MNSTKPFKYQQDLLTSYNTKSEFPQSCIMYKRSFLFFSNISELVCSVNQYLIKVHIPSLVSKPKKSVFGAKNASAILRLGLVSLSIFSMKAIRFKKCIFALREKLVSSKQFLRRKCIVFIFELFSL